MSPRTSTDLKIPTRQTNRGLNFSVTEMFLMKSNSISRVSLFIFTGEVKDSPAGKGKEYKLENRLSTFLDCSYSSLEERDVLTSTVPLANLLKLFVTSLLN